MQRKDLVDRHVQVQHNLFYTNMSRCGTKAHTQVQHMQALLDRYVQVQHKSACRQRLAEVQHRLLNTDSPGAAQHIQSSVEQAR
jgi:hypothetical protein